MNNINSAAEKIANLAAEMGVSVEDLASFIGCLSVWTNKGYTVEEAIRANLSTMETMLHRVSDGLTNEYSAFRSSANALKQHVASEVWDTVQAGR